MCYIKFFFFKITILLMSTGHNLKSNDYPKKQKKKKQAKKTSQLIQATPTSFVSKQTVKKACSDFKQSVPWTKRTVSCKKRQYRSRNEPYRSHTEAYCAKIESYYFKSYNTVRKAYRLKHCDCCSGTFQGL